MFQVLERVCKEVQKQAALYQESIRDAAELQDTTGVELFQGRTSGKARAMVVIKKEKLDRATNYARIMEELTMLGSFVRLADYLFVEGVMSRAVTAVEDLLNLLTQQKQQVCWLGLFVSVSDHESVPPHWSGIRLMSLQCCSCANPCLQQSSAVGIGQGGIEGAVLPLAAGKTAVLRHKPAYMLFMSLQADKQSKSVFQTTVAFESEGMSFTPNETAILDELNNNTIEGVVAVAQAAPRLVFMRAFAPYFEGKPSGLNAVNIIRSMPYFNTLRARINEAVISDFSAAKEAVKVQREVNMWLPLDCGLQSDSCMSLLVPDAVHRIDMTLPS